jgi:hypothetical protein
MYNQIGELGKIYLLNIGAFLFSFVDQVEVALRIIVLLLTIVYTITQIYRSHRSMRWERDEHKEKKG